ncbi:MULTISPECIES: OmpW/AlkL family protein [Acinetobacter]|uniref:OmpW/AlkL family protein n=1 Tax=Acinetobacter TaxID=469 RepID=UPI000E34A156|nr:MULTISPECIES: OmpW family outer membrane protein [Acinetobacter]RFS28989.1 OmpW family protein [Acinetobacter sp. SWAC5]RKG40671.1 OmpW family protein [Acinetobacter cumulans]RKG47872.1 OmpW family protein [Acinetobacter cumulans]RZG56901.1 OmpW family protein [Acinetobacter sp. WCHAc060006]
MLKQAALIALLGMSASAMAGQWQVKVGGSVVAPTSDTSILNGAVNVEADHEYAFTPSIEYFFNDNISAELLLATPISHDVNVTGAVDAGVKVKHLPPTITAKYNFKNSTRFTPYIGVGGTAFVAWDEKSSLGKVNVKESFGFAGQVGFNYQPADAKNWGVFVDARYAQIKPEVQIEGVPNFDLDINPMIYTMGYSYKF